MRLYIVAWISAWLRATLQRRISSNWPVIGTITGLILLTGAVPLYSAPSVRRVAVVGVVAGTELRKVNVACAPSMYSFKRSAFDVFVPSYTAARCTHLFRSTLALL